MPADGMPVAIEISKRELRHVQLATHKSLYRFSIPQHMSRPKSLVHHWQSLIPGARMPLALRRCIGSNCLGVGERIWLISL